MLLRYTGDPTESDDTFALDCTDSLDLQKLCDPSSSLAPGDIVQAPPLVREESVQIVHASNIWLDCLLDLDFQVPRYDVPHVMALKAGLLSNHYENLALDGTVWTQQRRLRNAKTNWDLEDSKAFLVRGDSSIADSCELLYSLDKARKCGELEGSWFVVWWTLQRVVQNA